MTLKKTIIIACLLLIGFLYIALFNMRASSVSATELIEFSTEGFVDADTLNNTNKLVVSNDHFELYLDETTSYFKVIDTRNGHVWESNPSIPDPWETDITKPITNSALDRQKSTLEISYYNQAGSMTSVNNYNRSIHHPQTILSPAGQKTFQIKYVENGFQVLYEIVDLEIDYLHFPKYIEKETFEAMEDYGLLSQIAYTGFNEELNAYEIVNYENMSRLVRARLFDVFYEKMDYTRERAISENESFGYFEQYEQFSFRIGVQVLLTDKGVKTSVINESLTETEDIRLGRITLYPLFGTAVSEIDGEATEGKIIVPDGSGAVIEFNNGKVLQNSYRQRLYGLDQSLLPYRMPEQRQKIHIPLYGMVKDDAAYAAIITEGDAMAAINAEVSGRTDSFNKAYTTFHLRERERVVIGSGFNTYGVDLWTRDIVRTDFTVDYRLLSGDDASYVGIANAYRDHLIEERNMTEKDNTRETVLTVEFIGAYDRRNFFLGVPYYSLDTMTTFKEAQTIMDALMENGVTNANVVFTGALNGGLENQLLSNVSIERVLGGQSGFDDFQDYLRENGMELYAGTNFMSASSYNKPFDKNRYTASRIRGNHAMVFNYHRPTGLPYSETSYFHRGDDFVINPAFYASLFDRFSGNFDYDNIMIADLGGSLAGHYDRNNLIYRQDALRFQESVLSASEFNMMLSGPLGFALPHAGTITDLPTVTTLYAIVDYEIPLMQLVLSGLVDYTAESINLPSERSARYQFLKHLETGSNLKYTLSHDDSRKLLNTDYNHYMSTQYENWLDTIAEQTSEIDALSLHEGRLVDHERLSRNLYKVTYSHGLSLVINYSLSAATHDGVTIAGLDYVVWEGN